MATLQTPQIIAINAFDPSYAYDLKFVYDDNQAVKNRLVLTDKDSGNIIYDVIQYGMKLSHNIPSNTLSSGKSYLAQIQVFDEDNNESNLSESVLFYCYSSPIFSLIGISVDEIIHKATLEVSLNYSQSDGELLKEFQFFLYNYDNSICTQSNVLYSSDSKKYIFYDLKNETSYYVRIVGETQHGMKLDTGMVMFHVNYVTIPANVVFEVENHCKEGYVSLFSGIIDIGYNILNDDYFLENGLLTLGNNVLTYDEGFSIAGNFTIQMEAKKIPLKKHFLLLNNGKVSLSIIEICERYYCCINIDNICQYKELPKARIITDNESYITDNYGNVLQLMNVDYEDNDLVVFEIKRIDGIWGVDVYYKSDVFPALSVEDENVA